MSARTSDADFRLSPGDVIRLVDNTPRRDGRGGCERGVHRWVVVSTDGAQAVIVPVCTAKEGHRNVCEVHREQMPDDAVRHRSYMAYARAVLRSVEVLEQLVRARSEPRTSRRAGLPSAEGVRYYGRCHPSTLARIVDGAGRDRETPDRVRRHLGLPTVAGRILRPSGD